MTTEDKKESWEEKFDKKFPKLWYAPDYVEYTFQEGEACSNDVKSFIRTLLESQQSEFTRTLINELESNPNLDGSISPNIQHWIEQKQIQLRKKFYQIK